MISTEIQFAIDTKLHNNELNIHIKHIAFFMFNSFTQLKIMKGNETLRDQKNSRNLK